MKTDFQRKSYISYSELYGLGSCIMYYFSFRKIGFTMICVFLFICFTKFQSEGKLRSLTSKRISDCKFDVLMHSGGHFLKFV